jgi:hypothetical protein
MPFLQIINTLSSIAEQIIGSSDKLKNQKKEQLIRTADALEEISSCLTQITDKLSKKDHDGLTSCCSELSFYLKRFNDLNLGAILGEEKTQLLVVLEKAVSERSGARMAMQLDGYSNSETSLIELEKASGIFKAASNILRATA